ncbi:esterase-like activity of phytase family protein [Oceanidesulfovibrio marinus]|nr:esterase-like activity of phytase family protein [Oceanidesulfovibrio marinus]
MDWGRKLSICAIAGVSCLCALSIACMPAFAGGKQNTDVLEKALKNVPKEGVLLPYTVLRDDLPDTQKPGQTFEIRNGGFGSSMTAHPTVANQFYALTDRGPNASYKGKYGNGKVFPTPEYTPRIGLFELREDGSVSLIKTILLRRPDGTPISGLPNSSDLGGTGETPYDAEGNPILADSSKPFNDDAASTDYNPLRLDDFGLDGEGLVALSDGTFWVSDEYGPHIVHFDAEGREIGRINPFSNDTRTRINLPAEFANRRPNRGMEGLAVTSDETTLVGIMQSTMRNPSKDLQKQDVTRIVTVNLKSGAIAQYLYKQEKPANSNSEIVALSDTVFIVDERDGSFALQKPDAQKHIYRIDLSTGTNLEAVTAAGTIQDETLGLLIDGKTVEQAVKDGGWDALAAKGIEPVQKSLVVDMVKTVGYPHDKMEGLWVINDHTLGVLNDDDFALWATDGKLHQKYLDAGTIDGNTLYIVDVDLSAE